MKNKSVFVFVMAVLLLLTVGCTADNDTGLTTTTVTTGTTTGVLPTTAATTARSSATTVVTTVTKQTATTVQADEFCGTGNWHYTRRYVLEFSIESALRNLVDKEEYEQWWNTFESRGGTRSKYEFNVYELIQEFGITRAQVEELCQNIAETFEGEVYFTDEQIEVLFTGTREDVYRYFAYPTAIFIAPGDQVYPPKWLAEHTAAEYLEVGITYEILEANILNVLDAPMSADAQDHIQAQREALRILCASTSSESVTTTTTLSQGE